MEINREIFSAAERFLSARSMSCFELRQKLSKKFPKKSNEIESVIKKCIQYGFLDDQKYAEMFLRFEKNRAAKSEFFLRKKLSEKGISSEIIDTVFAEEPIDEAKIALELAQKKAASLSPLLEKRKREEKIFRFLIGRGFSYSKARTAVEKRGEEENL